MKTSTYLLLVAAALTFGLPASDALAQNRPDEARPGPKQLSLLPSGTVPRYLVTFFRSVTADPALRTASIVSITNQSPVDCQVAVDWKLGFGGVVCGTNLVIGPGVQADFCSRTVPDGITTCNSTCSPSLVFDEGSAIVGSATTTGCGNIAVSARTYYTASTTDSPVSAITDPKVVKFGFGNSGD
jgi:hypothetical protein